MSGNTFFACVFLFASVLIAPGLTAPSRLPEPIFKANYAENIIHGQNRDEVMYYRCIQNGTIALTFDDGPAPGITEGVQDILRAKNVPATFFVVGSNGQIESPASQDTLRRTVANGHSIGHHSWTHTYPGLVGLSESELLDEMNPLTVALIKILGQRPTIMRPPFGAYDDQMVSIVNGRLGFKLIFWSIDTNDWAHPGDTQAGLSEYINILSGTNPAQTPGFIALHHDPLVGSAELASTTIDYATSVGYRYVSLKECLGL